MRDPARTLHICDDIDNLNCFYKFSSDEAQLGGRLKSRGFEARLKEISSRLAGVHDARHVEELLTKASRVMSLSDIETLVNEELSRFTQSPIYSAAVRTVDTDVFNGFVLYDDEEIRVSLVTVGAIALRVKKNKRDQNTVYGTTMQGTDSLIRFVKSGNAVLNLWKSEAFGRNEALTTRFMKPVPDAALSDDDVLFMEGGVDGMSIASLDSSVLFILVVRNRARIPVNAHYSSDGQLHSCTASDMKSSRIQLLATLIRELDWKAGSEHLSNLSDHPDHFVRWHLMRELVALDQPVARVRIERAATEDPHPQVREAAIKTIQILNEV
ncbi:hypothetical protein LU699_15530 [Luteimonas fraxinea]|uniref:hypothetical protein n=1 Tax=Luteimonas fraxinea TaxID=2901869 RepID=UPI001E4A2D29|nr:hypothetical protein [Luteimonas fraxinea]UHH09654.1 hypothetical protein LU699_15530 [Luteimonas fraxinea]